MKKLVLFAGVLVALTFASCNSAKQEAPATDAPEAVEAVAEECCKGETEGECCGKCEEGKEEGCCKEGKEGEEGCCKEGKAEGECDGKCEKHAEA